MVRKYWLYSSFHIKYTRQPSTQPTRQSILESPSHQTYLGNATLTTSPKSQLNPSFSTPKHPLKPTRSQSQSLQHLRTPECRVCLLCMVIFCWQPHQPTRYGPKKSGTVCQERLLSPEQCHRDGNLTTLDHTTEETWQGSPCSTRSNIILQMSLADPGGAHPARAPPNGRGPMIF